MPIYPNTIQLRFVRQVWVGLQELDVIGGILGPTIGGYLLASSLGIQLNFIVFAIPGLIAALAVFFTDRKVKQTIVPDKELEAVMK